MITFYKKTANRGQVMLVTVVFFLILSMVIVLGIATPILKQVSIAEESLLSKKSYYTSESAVEDVYYRLQHNHTVNASETLVLNGGQANVTTSDVFDGKEIVAEGNINDNIRKIQINLAKGTGVVFKYGTQAGQGGIIFKNNAILEGSLYSNGSIIGENGSYITGDAFAAGGLIDNVDIGVGGTGSAYANTVRNLDATGNLYCQTGSGNNKSCDTSKPDPEQIPLPIKQEDIDQWKADAAAGGTHTGNLEINSSTTLGPRRIAGDLTINGTLTLANTIHVTGDITLNVNAIVKLSSIYGASSGIIIADGVININNGVVFEDSGTEGSYILLLSTSNCDISMSGTPCNGRDAISVGNNSDIIIANAQNGTIFFSNNSSVKEAVANTLRLNNNSRISYGTGLINPNFSSGPSGGYNITHFGEIK